MCEQDWRNGKRVACAAAALALGMILAGCAENVPTTQSAPDQARSTPMWDSDRAPTPEEVARMIEPNVLGVSCFYDPFNPWLWNPEHTVVRGMKINALYLRGPNYTGVFGDGVIRPKLFVAYRDEKGLPQYKLVKEWSFNVEEAMPFRVKTQKKAGWGYGLFLNWGDLDLAGQSIRLTVQFERSDGIVISGSKKDFRVPKPSARG